VCDAKPTCVADLSSLILKAESLECSGFTPGDKPNEAIDWNPVIDTIKKYSNDVTVLTGYFCEHNCYAVTEAIINGDEGAATCECLLSYISKVHELSEDARDYLGLDSEVDSKVNSAIADKKCIANNNNNLRSSITQLKID